MAFISGNNNFKASGRLPDNTSIYNAEAYALFASLQKLKIDIFSFKTKRRDIILKKISYQTNIQNCKDAHKKTINYTNVDVQEFLKIIKKYRMED